MNTRESRRRDVNAPAGGGWRRTMRCAGVTLALFALVIQAVVGFGHHHFGFSVLRSSNAVVAAAALPAAQVPAPQRDRQHRPGDPCLVCLAIHAAAPPVADVLQAALPVHLDGTPMPLPTLAPLSVAYRAAAFDSRGPPLS